MVTANGTPSRNYAIQLGEPYLQLTELPLHAGQSELGRPGFGRCNRHSPRRQLKDRYSSNLKQETHIIGLGRTVNCTHVAYDPKARTRLLPVFYQIVTCVPTSTTRPVGIWK